ncbi:MAG: hypothetical protein IPO39_15755 [Bacteroidetes bacterium]|nr:hypothetical protein [Bacteroidota bacterium]MBK9543705.1 hypothetical protein [Bacteroidota bacterium]MBP6401961.1 hypothetical protein [Bacteroidia bacterium]
MELNPNDIDLLDRYFRGELNSDELNKLQIRLKDPELAEEVHAHNTVVQAINAAGQAELRESLSIIRKDIEKKKEFQKYHPSNKGGSGIGAVIIAGILVGSIAIGYYLISNFITLKEFNNTFPDETTIDTVYHYRVNRDTVFIQSKDSLGVKPVIQSKSDTVYIRVKKSSVIQFDSVSTKKEIHSRGTLLPH